VARRIVDRCVLHLIKMWLECSVDETDDRGRKTRTTEARDNRRGWFLEWPFLNDVYSATGRLSISKFPISKFPSEQFFNSIVVKSGDQ
jgi:hypothetical protein